MQYSENAMDSLFKSVVLFLVQVIFHPGLFPQEVSCQINSFVSNFNSLSVMYSDIFARAYPHSSNLGVSLNWLNFTFPLLLFQWLVERPVFCSHLFIVCLFGKYLSPDHFGDKGE